MLYKFLKKNRIMNDFIKFPSTRHIFPKKPGRLFVIYIKSYKVIRQSVIIHRMGCITPFTKENVLIQKNIKQSALPLVNPFL